MIGELLANSRAADRRVLTRSTVNRRYFYERMPAWPDNFAVLGDALAAYNPVYGHGMAVAAQSALLYGT